MAFIDIKDYPADLTGQQFGLLTVLHRVKRPKEKPKWLCQCECGNTKEVRRSNLARRRSCGCLRTTDLLHKQFGHLFVVKGGHRHPKTGKQLWECECDCGNTTLVGTSDLTSGKTRSCGKCQSSLIDITGKVFGRLTVLRRCEQTMSNKPKWVCRCRCGTEKSIRGDSLKDGSVQSCGCQKRENVAKASTRHGMADTPMHRVWRGMINRCHCKTGSGYDKYGGRGITVCERWRNSFKAFYEDMGPRPEGATIDRIDNDGNYEPGNCRWASYQVQTLNRNPRTKQSKNSTGVTGVTKSERGRYLAQLSVNGEMKLKRTYATFEEAIEARRSAELEHHTAIIHTPYIPPPKTRLSRLIKEVADA